MESIMSAPPQAASTKSKRAKNNEDERAELAVMRIVKTLGDTRQCERTAIQIWAIL
jgi:hypothetical protein